MTSKVFGKTLGVVKTMENEESQLSKATSVMMDARAVEQEKKVLLSRLVEWDAAFENYKQANPNSNATKQGTQIHNDIIRIIREFDKGNYSVAAVSRLKSIADKAEDVSRQFRTQR